MIQELTAAEKIAVAIAFKSDEITGLKKALPDGSSHEVSCVLKVTGKLAKTFGKAAASVTMPADVCLGGYRFLAALLSRLKIKPEQFATEAKSLAESVVTPETVTISDESFPESDVVSATLDTLASEIAAKLPTRTVENGGRAGSVSGQVSIEYFRISPTELAAMAMAPAALELAQQEAAAKNATPAKPARKKAAKRKAA